MSKAFNKIITVLFALLLFSLLIGVLAAGLYIADNEYSETENRYLSQAPSLSLSSVTDGSFMSGLESYLSDQFVHRDKVVSVKTYISRFLGKTKINDVYCGENNRLFEVPSEFDRDRMNSITDAVNQFAIDSKIENQYFLIAPNASYVYDNELPAFLECDNQKSQITEIYNMLYSEVKAVDVSDILKSNRDNASLYFRTDHHWTADAALLAFEELMSEMGIAFRKSDYENLTFSNSFSGTLASSSGIYEATDILSCILPKNVQGTYYVQNADTQEKSPGVFDFSKLENKNQYEVFFGGNFSRIIIRTENLNEKNLLVFKDSYANCFIPLLIPHFENIVIIDPRYYTDNIDHVLADTSFTHLLYLYNLNTLLEDSSLVDVIG